MAFVDVTVLFSSWFEVMVEIDLPINLTCKHKKIICSMLLPIDACGETM
jgi:hypothetical protein